jgi:hypothetical protein
MTLRLSAAHALALVALLGCSGPLEVYAADDHDISMKVGRELDLTIQNIGPTRYASPPEISSAAIRFIGDTVVTPGVPAGLTQLFRFEAIQAGDAVITFHQTEGSFTVQDTVHVQ